MPVEVEREEGEVSVKVDFENKDEVVVSPTAKEDVVNEISHGGNNGNGNDTDGSYVFISENDTGGDDSVESDSVKSVDVNVVEKEVNEGDYVDSEEVKMEVTSIEGDDVLGVSQGSQTLEKSEAERNDDGPEEVVGIPASEIEDFLEKSVQLENHGDVHLETGNEGELESTEEVDQLQDYEAGPRDLTENNAGCIIESDSKSDAEEHQEEMFEVKDHSDLDVDVDIDVSQHKSDLDVDVSQDLQHNEDVAKHPVDSDQARDSELVSSKVSPTDPSDGTDPAVNDYVESESAPVENGHPIIQSELEKIVDVPCILEKVNASDGDVLPDSRTVKVDVNEVSSDAPCTLEKVNASDGDVLPDSRTVKVDVSEVSSDAPCTLEKVNASDGDVLPDSRTVKVDVYEVSSDVPCTLEKVNASDGDVLPDSSTVKVDISEVSSDAPCILEKVNASDGDVLPDSRTVKVDVYEVSSDAPCTLENVNASDGDVLPDSRTVKVDVSEVSSDAPCTLEKVNASDGDVLPDSRTVKVDVYEVSSDVPCTLEKVNASDGDVLPDSSTVKVDISEVSSDAPCILEKVNASDGDVLPDSRTVKVDISEVSSDVPCTLENVNASDGDVLPDSRTVKVDVSEVRSDVPCTLEKVNASDGDVLPDSRTVKVDVSEVSSDVPCTLEKVNATDGDVLPDSRTVKVDVSEVSSDVQAETQTLTAVCLESHTSGKDGVVENGNSKSESEAIQDLDLVETSEVQSEIGAVDVSVSDGTMNIHPESQDTSEPACDEDGKQHIASLVTDILDAPTSEERSDDVIVAEKSISEDAAARTDDKVASTCEIEETRNHLASALSVEGPALDVSEGHTVAVEIERRPFYFLPRVPRYDDEKLSEQLKHAEDQLKQKTQNRDALRADIQEIRATCKDYDISYKEAMAEERSGRKAMHSKRQEIEALQSMINRVKSVASVDDIDSRVHNMEHIIQHETISLKEEKGFIREINQLKQLREQISSSMGTKDEVKQALEEKDKTEERLKVLRKELDILRNDLSKAEAITKAAKKKCDEEWEVQSKLQEQFRVADAVRQEAFVHLQDLKKRQREKNKYFFKYRDDSKAASEMALQKDRAALQSLCSDQVENFMNMWNNDEEFRNYYVRCNTRSTYRRLGTLDGRSLGPDEEPPRITYATRNKLRTSSDRLEKLETIPPVSAQQEKVVKCEGSEVENNGKAVAKPAEQKSHTIKSKKTIKQDQPAPIVTELVSEKEEIEKSATKEEEETPKLSKEEEELIKKEEEKRKQKEAAKMKEQHRLEEIAKAKEAMERKKKREEKAKARAVLKAQKDAEEREKEREKKLRKKERRQEIFISEETATENPIQTSETVIETPREIEIPKKQTVEENQQIKKSHKPSSQFLKQNKSKSVPLPLPLRNRGNKRKLRQWMWIGLIIVAILALFLLGSANLSVSPANLWFI